MGIPAVEPGSFSKQSVPAGICAWAVLTPKSKAAARIATKINEAALISLCTYDLSMFMGALQLRHVALLVVMGS